MTGKGPGDFSKKASTTLRSSSRSPIPHWPPIDSTGKLAGFGLEPVPSAFPSFIDDDIILSETSDKKTFIYQLQHLFDIDQKHQITYGLEYVPLRLKTRTVSRSINSTGIINFCDELFLPSMECYSFPEVRSSLETTRIRENRRFQTAYFNDRWKPWQDVMLEFGAFYESYKDAHNDYHEIHPRAGMAFKLGNSQILRISFQKWLQPDISLIGALAPVSTAGLVVDNSYELSGTRLADYQARLESRWTDRFFTALGVERIELKDPDFGPGFISRKGCISHFTAAINTIVTRQIGAFLKYRLFDSENSAEENRGRELPLVPESTFSAGLVWVSTRHVKANISTSYVGEKNGDFANITKIGSYWKTDLSLMTEQFKKRLLLSLNVNNIFDKHFEMLPSVPEAGRAISFTFEYRF